jgi:hypothetical protein
VRKKRGLAEGMGLVIAQAIERAFQPERRCPQCYQPMPAVKFVGRDGWITRLCRKCREKYTRWEKMTLEEKAHAAGSKHPPTRLYGRMSFQLVSQNKKTGPIPVSMSEPGTCPPSCAFYDTGCYALYGKLSISWRRTSARGIPWDEFLRRVASLPDGTLWRHNQAGDLAGAGDAIDGDALRALTTANAGKRGFTFTHKPVLRTVPLTPFRRAQKRRNSPRPSAMVLSNRRHIARANAQGFTVNLSADSIEEADALHALGIGPVVTVLPENAPHRIETPKGNLVVVCPAQTGNRTCATCGLCAKTQRKAIIGFRAHGQFSTLVSELVRSKRQEHHVAQSA